MTTRLRLSLLLLISLTVNLLSGVQSGYAQDQGDRYFAETGHWLKGDFKLRYESAFNPRRLYGSPITDAYLDPEMGKQVQYFEKALFILEPDAPALLRVRLAALGSLKYSFDMPESQPSPAAGCRSYAETGFLVCYAFLDFFETYGGVAQFGYPISNFLMLDGRIVQYFQLARLEFDPEQPRGERVVVANLGREAFTQNEQDPARLLPNIVNTIARLQTVWSLQVRAFLSRAVLPVKGTQTFYVVVQDQNSRPVANARVLLKIKLPSGEIETLELQPTNEQGFTSGDFTYHARSLGVVEVEVTANLEDPQLTQKTQTSFRIWW